MDSSSIWWLVCEPHMNMMKLYHVSIQCTGSFSFMSYHSNVCRPVTNVAMLLTVRNRTRRWQQQMTVKHANASVNTTVSMFVEETSIKSWFQSACIMQERVDGMVTCGFCSYRWELWIYQWHIQQNSPNVWYVNPDNLALDGSSPTTGSVTFYQKKSFINGKQTDLTDMFKRPSKSVYGISWPPVSHSSKFFNYEDSENTEENLDDPESADERDNPNVIPFWLVVQPKYRSSHKNYLWERQCR